MHAQTSVALRLYRWLTAARVGRAKHAWASLADGVSVGAAATASDQKEATITSANILACSDLEPTATEPTSS